MKFYRHEITERFRQRFERLYGDRAELCLKRLEMVVGRYEVGLKPEPPESMWDQSTSVLITYADMVGRDGEKGLRTLKRFCDNHLQGALSHVHVLPFCPYSSDDGFSVIDYRQVNEDFGDWKDMVDLGEHFGLMFDLVLNHCSRKSSWFKQFVGGVLPGRDYFHVVDPETDLSQVVRPRTHPLLTKVSARDGESYVWTTFSEDQVDLDFSNPDVLFEFIDILFYYIAKGARIIRLDAIAYLWKKIGTSCIHLEETHEVVKLLRDVIEMVAPQTIILTETNVPHKENVSYFGDGDEAHMVYQFSLPPLLLHALLTENAKYLTDWAASLGEIPAGCTYLNFTASHDGVGVRPLEGIVPDAELQKLVEHVRERGGKVSCKTNADGTESPYEMNVTYFDAVCESDGAPSDLDIARFLCSQTIPLVLKGVPAFYFHSLTATRNYHEGVEELGYARAINRMKWNEHDLQLLLEDRSTATSRVFDALRGIMSKRAEHPAFHPESAQEILTIDPAIFAVKRSAEDGETILSLSNVTRETVQAHVAEQLPLFGGELMDALSGEAVPGQAVELAPYQTRWLVMPGQG